MTFSDLSGTKLKYYELLTSYFKNMYVSKNVI